MANQQQRKTSPHPQSETDDDIVIVGGGLAGLFCALKLSPRPVTIITAATIGEGASSAWAQGGIAAAVAEGDTAEAHARDTIAAGAGIVDDEIARGMTAEAAARVYDLLEYGVPFDKDLAGHLHVGREAAHSTRRIVHVTGDRAGHAIMRALVDAVRKSPTIHLIEGAKAEELLVQDGAVCGVRIQLNDHRGTLRAVIPARAVVLATGGIGYLYAVTTNPPQARGTGLAIAARAGAIVADPEFVQFHPTAIAIGRDPAPLASEALRGEGATLVNAAGERFMLKRDPQGELAPRDIVARGVFAEIAAGRGAFLDARKAIGASFPQRFPTVYQSCIAAGIDPVRDLIPVAPAAHYHMGGVMTDARGRTSLDGLWAAGEVASTGAHGANRLASNSLLEAVVFAARIAADISGQAWQPTGQRMPVDGPAPFPEMPDTNATEQALRQMMAMHVGVIRDGDRLALAMAAITRIERTSRAQPTLHNMAVAALLIAAAAWRRRESRGAHFRSDCPHADASQAHRTFLTLSDARAIAEEAAAGVARVAQPAT